MVCLALFPSPVLCLNFVAIGRVGLQEHRHTESEMVGRSRSPTLGRLRKQGQVATLMQVPVPISHSLSLSC
jgi:hypothetical protein